MWKEAVLIYFNVLLQNFLWELIEMKIIPVSFHGPPAGI
jgi:hypothetical protein